jgi:hypothetical protein
VLGSPLQCSALLLSEGSGQHPCWRVVSTVFGRSFTGYC